MAAYICKGINSQTKEMYRAFDYQDIPLFSEKYHSKNPTSTSCIICGRDTSKNGHSSGVIVGEGGDLIVHPEDNEKAMDNGYMGWFPIGSECIKAIPLEFRQAHIYS